MSYRKKVLPPGEARVTLREIGERLNVTPMTIDGWRKGSRLRLPLPHTLEAVGVEGRHRVVITEAGLETWLTAYRPDLLERWRMSA